MKTVIVCLAIWAVGMVWARPVWGDPAAAAGFVVSVSGDDGAVGTSAAPFVTLERARRAASVAPKPVRIVVRAGTYYLPDTLALGKADSGVTWQAAEGETVVLSGGIKLALKWEPWRDGIFKAATPAGLSIDQLFVNGTRRMMARYPNYDPGVRPYGGYAADAFGPERAARWANPAGGFIHAMHRAHWGGYHYRITGKNATGEITYEGGWQNNRQMGMHPQHRFVENIFEELDAPGEWYHDAAAATLYYYPVKGEDPGAATVEVVRLRHLVALNGAAGVMLRGFVFRHAARTFMDTKEPLLRSDWTVYRGGAVRFEGCEDCTVADCEFDQLGGNAVFVNNYNRRIRIVGCDIHDTGASAVAFVGDPAAVRNPLFEYNRTQGYADIDKTPGPRTENYPADCEVDDCLLRNFGLVEKQATGVEISMSMSITVRHCSIYGASRAGINVSEGTWGGHTIEFCDVFDTVLETGDHGSFNSWGRDRYWHLRNAPHDELPKLALLDAFKPTTIRNSRWRCDHGWDVDLDDGSSNYRIYNNLFLHGGLKLREGFHRMVWNNIAVNNTFHPHVWYDNCGDVVTNNIWMGAYRPAGGMPKGPWGKTVDYNLFTTSEADRTRFAQHGCDAHSLVGDPMFVDPAAGDYRVKEGSPALTLGFRNFPVNEFGVRKPALRAIARTPVLPAAVAPPPASAGGEGDGRPPAATPYWQQARVRALAGEEYSAYGIAKDAGGVLLEAVAAGSSLSAVGLRAGDVVLQVGAAAVHGVQELSRATDAGGGKPLSVRFVRGQAEQVIELPDYVYAVSEGARGANFVALDLLSPACVADVKQVATRPATCNEPPAVLHDGRLAGNYGPVFANGVRGGLYKLELGGALELVELRTWSFNLNRKRGSQHFVVYGSARERDPGWDVDDGKAFVPLGGVDVPTTDAYLATALRRAGGRPLGRYRWLVVQTWPVTGIGENTAFQEIQAVTKPR